MRLPTFLVILIAGSNAMGAISKYNEEENRAYEFGFNIEGYQHRHESKDERGIIMGEFGFITADGVYHVTAYATDENGNFKILFMKNIKIGLPGNQSASALQLPRQPSSTTTSTTASPKQSIRPLSLRQFESNTRSCSGCAIPGSMKENQAGNLNEISNEFEFKQFPANKSKSATDRKQLRTNQKSTENLIKRPQVSSSGGSTTYPNENLQPKAQQDSKKLNSKPIVVNNVASFEKRRPKLRDEKANGQHTSAISNARSDYRARDKSIRFSSSMKNQQTERKSPKAHKLGVKSNEESLKAGIDQATLEEMRNTLGGLLYKFNYTVGYHGHHEKGDFHGSKDGGYHFVGRDGFRRNVEYIANDFGYQPYLTLDQVNDSKVPKKETENQAGLQGYEFKWFSERE